MRAIESGIPRRLAPRANTRRRGLTLLEVILSIAILGGALVVIGQLVNLGYRSAIQARLRSDANILVDSKMSEIVAGVVELQSIGGAVIEEDPNWAYSIDVQETPVLGLLSVTVSVSRIDSAVPIKMSIVRFVPDPDFDPLEDQE